MDYSSPSSSNATLDFTDNEIRSELSRLGYNDIGEDQFEEFKRDLITLVTAEKSKSFHSNDTADFSTAVDYHSLYAQEPEINHMLEKENPWSSKSITISKTLREPLSTTSNTVHLQGSRKSPEKPGYYYTDNDESFSKSLPMRNQLVEDLYQPLDAVYNLPRPGSADQMFRYGKARNTPEKIFPSTDGQVKHLDYYWQGGTDRYDKSDSYKPAYHSERLRDVTERTLEDDLEDKLNISRVSQGSIMKRKISRKMEDGTSQVYEESYTKEDLSESDTESCKSEPVPRVNSHLGNRVGSSNTTRSKSVARNRPVSARYDKSLDPVMSAVIWPESKPVGGLKSNKKIDPVNRYLQYQQEWKKTKVPEEKLHKNLRWAVREQMLYKDIIYEKPQKKFVENKYIVPTDKKRKDLRWRIRADMAAGFIPSGH